MVFTVWLTKTFAPNAKGHGTEKVIKAIHFKLSKEHRKKIVICGISAGFAAVFGTPISGAI